MADAPTPTLSILIVEDDEAVAELLRQLLGEVEGWGATVARDAAAAREVLRQVRIDVLVLDLELPGISGLELLGLLRGDEAWGEAPVIVVSVAADEPGMREALRRAEVARVIAKPFAVDEVVRAVAEATAQRPPDR